MTTTTTADPRAALLARLEQLEDAAAQPGPAADLALLLGAAGGALRILEAGRRAVPGGDNSGGLP
jgi:hypothetical protein